MRFRTLRNYARYLQSSSNLPPPEAKPNSRQQGLGSRFSKTSRMEGVRFSRKKHKRRKKRGA
jgi:hypothetical protein